MPHRANLKRVLSAGVASQDAGVGSKPPAGTMAILYRDSLKGGTFPFHFGIELEFDSGMEVRTESYSVYKRRKWMLKYDGSVSGGELVSPHLGGNISGIEKDIANNIATLDVYNPMISVSCGFHVHIFIPGTDKRVRERVWWIYSRLQEEISSMLPPSRRGNKYCKALDGGPKYHDRYYAVNLTSYEKCQSVEFRQHSGTLELEKIMAWVHICQAIVFTAMRGGNPSSLKELGLPYWVERYVERRKKKFAQ